MPFLTRPHFEDRQIVQYSDEVIHLSGTSYIAATILDFTGTTTGETSVTINSLTGYLNGQRLSGLVVEPAQLKLSGSTGTTTQNVTGFVLQSIDPYGSVEWAPISGVSWSVSACTSPLYVSTIEACPNPTDPIYITAGNVQFGASPSLIADITNTRLGIGIPSPTERLHVSGGDILVETSNGKIYTDLDFAIGPQLRLSGNSTDLITMGTTDSGVNGTIVGVRGDTEPSYPGYGKQGDGFLYSSAEQNGLNIISQDGTNKDDYIRLYAGKDANGTTPDIHIQGSGTTKGNVGINTITPTERLHIKDGNVLIEHDQNTTTRVGVSNLGGGNDSFAQFSLSVSGTSSPNSKFGSIIAIGPDSVPTGSFMGSYLPDSLNIMTANGLAAERLHINIGSRRTNGETRFFGGSDDFNSSSLLGVFYTSGLTITDMVNTDTLRVRDGATSGYVLTSDSSGNATWQYNSTGFSGNTSASCITDLYVSNVYGCSPITIHDTITYNGCIIDSATTNSFIFGDSHVLTGTSGTHGTGFDSNVLLGGSNNRITPFQIGTYNTIIGGSNNTLGISRLLSSSIISSDDSTISGSNGPNVILGGSNNTLDGSNGNVILGGFTNSLTTGSGRSVIVGGRDNIISGVTDSVIIGGDNIVATSDSTVYVPSLNIGTASNDNVLSNILVRDSDGTIKYRAASSLTFSWSDPVVTSGNTSASCITDLYVSNLYGCSPITIHDSVQHTGSTASGTKSVAFGLDNVTNSDNSAILSGNDNNIDSSDNSTIGSGKFNTITGGTDNFIATGGFTSVAFGNQILGASRSFIGGGRVNKILTSDSSIAGGSSNTLNGGSRSFIGGGGGNQLNGGSASSTIVGGNNNTIDIGKYSFIGGGITNLMVSSQSSVIGGGGSNNLHYSPYSSIVGGQDNILSGSSINSSIVGGQDNTLNDSSTHSSIVGGQGNTLSDSGTHSSIVGGQGNTLNGSNYSSIVGGQSNIILSGGTHSSIGGGAGNTILNAYNTFIGGGRVNTILNGSNYSSIVGGEDNTLSGASHSSIVGGIGNNIISAGTKVTTYSSIVGGEDNTLSGTSHSSIVGGNDILGTTDNTVYTPNLTVRGDYVLHSDEVLEVSDVPGSLEGTMKGSYTEFNHNLTTANIISNNNVSGFTSVIIGDLSNYPTKKSFGFISYYNSQFTRTGTPPVGTDFNRGKLVFKASEDTVGMIINPRAGDPSAPLWFEVDGTSVMKLQGDGAGKANLGIAMSQDGTETASANLQIGGTGTTGTFKYIDGNEQSGYVLTSDADGNAAWQVSTASGGTSSGNLFSSTERALNNTPLNYGLSSGTPISAITYTTYTIQNPWSDDPNSMITGSTFSPSTGGTFTDKTYTLPLGTLDDGDILNFKLKFSRGILGDILTVPVTDDDIFTTSLSHTQLRIDGDFYDDNYILALGGTFDLNPTALTGGTVPGIGFMYRSDKPPALSDAQLTGTTLLHWDTLVNVGMVRIDATTLNITTTVEYKLRQPWTIHVTSSRQIDGNVYRSSSNTNFTVNDMDSNPIVFDAAGWCFGSSVISPSTSPENIYCDYMIIDLNKKI